jgi:hypothetical protein
VFFSGVWKGAKVAGNGVKMAFLGIRGKNF